MRLEAARSAAAIEIAGHIEEAATEAWARTFADPNLHRFCVDFVSFLPVGGTKIRGLWRGGLEQMAAVCEKQNTCPEDLATIELSYSIVYPSRISQSRPDKADAQLTDRIIWASQFAAFCRAFEGGAMPALTFVSKRSLEPDCQGH
ncbi:hypothetical protein ACHAWO_005807 [Cyclotella atomus]|uniref:Uncharacterized protein n=1 Tax=Cyclotella atomus TaxID=382360 RepID=A0ABD3P1E5_9STRA